MAKGPCRWARAATAAGFLVWGKSAWAGPQIELSWSAPEGCPTQQQVLDRASKLVARAQTSRTLQAHGVISATEGGFELKLATDVAGELGSRSLSAAQCQDLAEPAALVLAVAVAPEVLEGDSAGNDPNATGRLPDTAETKPAQAAPPPAPVAPVVPPQPETPRSAAPVPSDDVWLRLGLAGLLDVGQLPGPAPGALAHLGLGVSPWWLELRGSLLATQSQELRGGLGGEFRARGAELVGCWRVIQAGELSPCAGVGAHRISGFGTGVNDPGSGQAWHWAGVLGGRASVELLAPLRGLARAELSVPIQRRRFVLDNVGLVHRPSAVWGRFSLGLEAVFP